MNLGRLGLYFFYKHYYVAELLSAVSEFRLRESCLPRSGSALGAAAVLWKKSVFLHFNLQNTIFEELKLKHMLEGLAYNYIFLYNLM